MSNTEFDVTIADDTFSKLLGPAHDEAKKAYDKGERGMVLAQCVRQQNGSIRVKGRFVPLSKAARINAIMKEPE